MKVRATISFVGAISMRKNEERECVENDTLQDLINCGYVVPIESKKAEAKKNEIKRSNTK